MQRIRKELFPDIRYGDETNGNETICTSGEDSPFVLVPEKEHANGKQLFL